MGVVIYHNPNCGTPRNTLALICNSDTEPTIIYHLETLPSRDKLRQLIVVMAIPVRALLRENVEPYGALGLAEDRFTDSRLIDFMLQHPILINHPIVTTLRDTRFYRPSEVVLEILVVSQKSAFVKEDDEPVIDAAGQRVKWLARGTGFDSRLPHFPSHHPPQQTLWARIIPGRGMLPLSVVSTSFHLFSLLFLSLS